MMLRNIEDNEKLAYSIKLFDQLACT